MLSVNRLGTLCDLSTCLLGTLGLAGTGDCKHLMPCLGCTGGDTSKMVYMDTSDNFGDILRGLQSGDQLAQEYCQQIHARPPEI